MDLDLNNFTLEIHRDDSPILHKRAEELPPFRLKDEQVFIQRMFDFMHEHGGVGLAAPQIGLPYRFFIMNIAGWGQRVCINPYIASKTETMTPYKEGCLSYPGLRLTLRRPDAILVDYNDHRGELRQEQLSGLPARVFQHEVDHLRGVVFTDLASPTKLRMAKSKVKQNLKKMKRAGKL